MAMSTNKHKLSTNIAKHSENRGPQHYTLKNKPTPQSVYILYVCTHTHFIPYIYIFIFAHVDIGSLSWFQ